MVEHDRTRAAPSVLQAYTDQLELHLGEIAAQCRELDPALIALVLHGPYARNEGGWYTTPGGKIRPYNRYRIIIVTRSRIKKSVMRSLGDEIARNVHIRHVTLHRLSPAKLASLAPHIYNYDLKYSGRVFFGDETILQSIPPYAASDIPQDAARLLAFQRAGDLLNCFGHDGGPNHSLAGDSSRYFRNQMARTVLASVDIMLLMQHRYASTNAKRLSLFEELYPMEEHILEQARWALDEQLSPRAPSMTPDEVSTIYHGTLHLFLNSMYMAMSLLLSRPIEDPDDLQRAFYRSPHYLIQRLRWASRWGWREERFIKTSIAQVYLAEVARHPEHGIDYMVAASSLLRQLDPRLPHTMAWNDARIEAGRIAREV